MAEKVNRLRKEREEEIPLAGKKSSERKKFNFNFNFEHGRVQKIIGFIFLLFALFLFVAFNSFLLTWQSDQSVVANSSWKILFDAENNKVENWLGILGAMLAHQFIFLWFGLSSYLFILLFLIIGYRLVFEKSIYPVGRAIAYTLFFVVFASLVSGFLFSLSSEAYRNFAGAYGLRLNDWLVLTVGRVGTLAILAFAFIIWMIAAFNTDFKRKPKEKVDVNSDLIPVPPTEQEIIEEEVRSRPIEFPVKNSKINQSTGPELKVEEEIIEPISAVHQPEMVIAPLIREPESEAKTLAKSLVDAIGEYDSTLDLSTYQYPSLELLDNHGNGKISVNSDELEANKNKIVETLGHYNIEIDKIKATIGPTVTLYEIIPAAGVRISKIKNLEDDIALSLAALGIRIIAPIPGKGTIGIEVPNLNPEMVSMRSILATDKYQHTTMDLPIALGKTISNEVFIADLSKMPHLLMAGATGQGKSVGINALLVSLLYKKHPSQVKFVMVDPKKVELTLFKKIERHFLAKLPNEAEAIITDTKKVINTLNSLCIEMDQRYDLLKDAQVRNLKEYNQKFNSRLLNPENGHRYLPYIVLVIDEFADLMMTAGKEVETPIARLAQLARAIGIHLVIATQRPSVNIITGTIKANFPARLAFRVSSKIDSRTILDSGGADQLIGRGDMLLSTGNELIRLQCAFVDTHEVERITEFIGSQRGYATAHLLPEYVDENGEGSSAKSFDIGDKDPLFEDAARLIVMHQQGSTSLIQRKLKLGYNRAGRIIDQLEATGIVGPFEGSKAREVLYPDEYSLEQYLNTLNNKSANS